MQITADNFTHSAQFTITVGLWTIPNGVKLKAWSVSLQDTWPDGVDYVGRGDTPQEAFSAALEALRISWEEE